MTVAYLSPKPYTLKARAKGCHLSLQLLLPVLVFLLLGGALRRDHGVLENQVPPFGVPRTMIVIVSRYANICACICILLKWNPYLCNPYVGLGFSGSPLISAKELFLQCMLKTIRMHGLIPDELQPKVLEGVLE